MAAERDISGGAALALFVLGPVVAVVAALAGVTATARVASRHGGRTHGVAALSTAAAGTDVPLPGRDDVAFAASRAMTATVEIRGDRCGVTVTGSGFAASAELVVTAAHVVREINDPVVTADDGPHAATTVLFDPERDVAVLRVTGLSAMPLRLAAPGDARATAILGFPGGGQLEAEAVTMLREEAVVPRDIGLAGSATQPIWLVHGLVLAGDSGGPVVRNDGAAVGMVVARSTIYDMLGYAVGADHIAPAIAAAHDRTLPVSTGSC